MIGCGNILRGDDAVGPVLARTLFHRGVPDGVRVVDGGTSGMDVAFGMRGARRVVIIDASRVGTAPGTLFRVPADQLENPPPLSGLHSHNFRWDHALAFAEWLLGPHKPKDITVFLVEAGDLEPGAPLSPPVQEAMDRVVELIETEFYPTREESDDDDPVDVELNAGGYLHLPRDLAARWFPSDALVARTDGDHLVLMPLVSAANGGLVLRQRNPIGDRTVLIHEVLGFDHLPGRYLAHWDPGHGALVVDLGAQGGTAHGLDRPTDRGRDARGPGAGAVDGAAGAAGLQRDPAPGAEPSPDRGAGPSHGRLRETDGGAQASAEGGRR